jgi:hypothetical protein
MAGSSRLWLVPSVSRPRAAGGSVIPVKKIVKSAKSDYRAAINNDLGCPLISQPASALGRPRYWSSDNPDPHCNGCR